MPAPGAPRALQPFRYSGPTSGLTLRLDDGTEHEQLLHDGADVSLPADHPHVQSLVAQGFLMPTHPPTTTMNPPTSAAAAEGSAASRRSGRTSSSDATTPERS